MFLSNSMLHIGNFVFEIMAFPVQKVLLVFKRFR